MRTYLGANMLALAMTLNRFKKESKSHDMTNHQIALN